ncbi:RodZ domain-containing protein [Pelagibius marinus]|uniref:RodZ domain-containing protein n=1 Tax=Pelagibius marinus TaxID=2762760 RepID=UPI001872E1B5|nr:RodZ domain-containing protein [Pelagibius marinus]
MVTQPTAPQADPLAAPQAADISGAAAESAPQVAVAAPEAPEAAETPAAAGETPASSEPYAIPAAPDNGTPATAFLTNHEPQVYGAENADARIVLKASQDAWVQVRDRQGTLLLTRVLRVGDTYQVPNQDDLTLLTGNAGGLEILVDGRALAPLGPVGAVRRNIPLNPEALLGGASN